MLLPGMGDRQDEMREETPLATLKILLVRRRGVLLVAHLRADGSRNLRVLTAR